MEEIILTMPERAILSNQNRILSILDPEHAEEYNHLADIAEEGYPYFYGNLISNISRETPLDICEETTSILNMYRGINNSIARLTEDEKTKLDLEKLKFEGFDANNDKHYHFMSFAVDKCDLYVEYKEKYYNSHDIQTIDKYRKMLKIYNSVDVKHSLTFEDLKNLCEKI